jgi:hypothetical protein
VALAKVSIWAAQILVLISKVAVIALLELAVSLLLQGVFRNLLFLPLKQEEVGELLTCLQ